MRRTPRDTRPSFHAQIFLCAVKFSRNPSHHDGKTARCLCRNGIWTRRLMAKNPPLNPEKPPPARRGRPSRKEELQRALAGIGIDPALVDPRRVLASIAGDADAPASARVAAAKALLDERRNPAETKQPKAEPKRLVAQRAAASAGGAGSGWGDDLAWSNGLRLSLSRPTPSRA